MFSKNERVQDPLHKIEGYYQEKDLQPSEKDKQPKKDNWEEWCLETLSGVWIITLLKDVPLTPAHKSFGVRHWNQSLRHQISVFQASWEE